MKITIRFSVSSLFVSLLIVVSLCIITINYYTITLMLYSSAQDLLNKTGGLIKVEITNYLGNIQSQTENGAEFLKKNIISLQKEGELKQYLINLVVNQPTISGAYVSSATGSFYSVKRGLVKNKFSLRIINRDTQPFYQIDGIMDNYGNILSSTKTFDLQYDPRLRPWYKEVVAKRDFGWSNIYKFARGIDIYGVTASKPVYDKNGELQTIFSIDATVNIFSNYISRLSVTPNTFLYVADSNNNIITANKVIANEELTPTEVDSLRNLTIPWVKYSLELFNKETKKIFQFKFNGNLYLANYEKLPGFFGDSAIIGIVLPLDDVIGPLKKNVVHLLLITIVLLLLGLLFANILAKKLSRPIVALADDAKEIAKMKIGKDSEVKSWIIEVIDMTTAFNLMKHALRSFVRYVPFTLVKQLVQSGEVAKVGGKNKDVTLLFADVQGFTSLSETMPPAVLMEFLSEFFEGMTRVINKSKGTIDKYIGDSIMAFWGAPVDDEAHAANACRCALQMFRALNEINQQWLKQGKPQLHIRIGINSANVIVGNVGSSDRLSYTVIGDGVNLASRLEGLNKIYGTSILVGENTYKQVKQFADEFAFRLIDEVAVRGKKLGGRVYELLNFEAVVNIFGNNLTEYNSSFMEAFQLYQQGQWDGAIVRFKELQNKYPKDGLISFYIARAILLRERRPSNWRGVWEQDHV